MYEAKNKITLTTIFAVIKIAIGTFFSVFMLLGIIGGSLADPELVTFTFFWLAVGILLIISGVFNFKFIKGYKRYYNLISYECITSIEQLARNVGKSSEDTKKDIQKLIDKSYFKDMHIDSVTERLVLGKGNDIKDVIKNQTEEASNIKKELVICKACGATNECVANVPSYCEYCGEIL